MKILSASRNVINSEDIGPWLAENFSERYSSLTLWTSTVVRKWCIKNAPVVDAPRVPTEGMPDWLRKALQDPAAVAPQNVVLDDVLRLRLQQVLDYMSELVSEKPDTNLASIGYDVAEQRAKKWHEDMQATQTRQTPSEEDGTKIILPYADGWSWREVEGEDAMNREGELMGHCVGRFGYYQQVMRAKIKIISLRDAKNVPHVTIEISEHRQAVRQIRGTANAEVIPKYLPRVADYLKSRSWKTIAFDGARAIASEVTQHHISKAPPIAEYNEVRAIYNLAEASSGEHKIYLVFKDEPLAVALYGQDKTLTALRYLQELPSATKQTLCDMARTWCATSGLRTDKDTLNMLTVGTNWTNNAQEWCTPGNKQAVDLCRILGGADTVCMDADQIVGWTSGHSLIFDRLLSVVKQRVFALSCGMTPQKVLYAENWTEAFVDAPTVQTWIAKNRAGKSVVSTNDLDLLNSLLTALKQPDAASIKEAYRRVKDVETLTDQKVKSLGFPTSGRSINAVGVLLMCSLPIKNAAPFKRYVFGKPNTLNCWHEVMATPDYLSNSLRSYGLSDVVVHKVLELLRNEFLRLTPTEAELTELDLEGGIEMRVRAGMRYAAAHRQDKLRSKALWSVL